MGETDGLARADWSEVDLLIQRCAHGDQSAFRNLYDLQSPRLHGLALRLLKQPALAADAVHDAFVQVWQNSAKFDPSRGQAEVWLSSLVRYRAFDILRRRTREQYGLEREDEPDTAPDALSMLTTHADADALHRCLAGLDETHRRAVQLAFIDGLSHSELATRLEAPLGTVKSWIRRALLGLRQCLEA